MDRPYYLINNLRFLVDNNIFGSRPKSWYQNYGFWVESKIFDLNSFFSHRYLLFHEKRFSGRNLFLESRLNFWPKNHFRLENLFSHENKFLALKTRFWLEINLLPKKIVVSSKIYRICFWLENTRLYFCSNIVLKFGPFTRYYF